MRSRRFAVGLVAAATLGIVAGRTAAGRQIRRLGTAVGQRAANRLLPLPLGAVAGSSAVQGRPSVVFPERELLRQCVHCGLCLPFCPTYRVLGLEADSPRGRIHQMRLAAEGKIDPSDPNFRKHMFQCLDCRACETACPSGVQYGRLIEAARSIIPPKNGTEQAVRRAILDGLVNSRKLLAAAGAGARLYQRSGLQRLVRGSGMLGVARRLGRMEAMLPQLEGPLVSEPLPVYLPAQGERRHRVHRRCWRGLRQDREGDQ